MENIIFITIHYITLMTLFSLGYYLGLKIGKLIRTQEIIEIIKEEGEKDNERENN